MMQVELNPELTQADRERISKIFELVDWGTRTPEEIKQAFSKSSVVSIVKHDAQIVGFGRTVDDGKYYALLVDVVVHPSFQAKGIGKTIVNTLLEQLQGYNFVTLTAAPNKEGFYRKLGWKKQKSAFMLPKDEKQLLEHCE